MMIAYLALDALDLVVAKHVATRIAQTLQRCSQTLLDNHAEKSYLL